MTALAAAQPQEPVRQDAALAEGVELCFDESWQLCPGAGFGARDETGRVLLYQVLQRGLFRAVALVAKRCATRRPLGLQASGLHEGSRRGEPARYSAPQSLGGLPTEVCPPPRDLLQVPMCRTDRLVWGGEIRTADVS